jgi:Na+/H+-translocating membrane pyrophosphatase
LTQEALSRADVDGIEEDHPKNPASFVLHLGEGYISAMQGSLEYVALGSFAYVSIYFFYLDSDLLEYVDYALDAPMAVFATCLLVKAVLAPLLRLVAIRGATHTEIDMKNVETYELCHSIIDNLFTLACFIFFAWLLLPDYFLGDSTRAVGVWKQFLSFLVCILFVFFTRLFQGFFIFPRYRPGQSLQNSVRSSLSLTIITSNNFAGVQTLFNMIVYPIVLLVIYNYLEALGVCYFLLALFVSYSNVKGLEMLQPIAATAEILIQTSRLNSEVNASGSFKLISYTSRVLGDLYSGVSHYLIFTMVFLIVKYVQEALDLEVSFDLYSMLFSFLLISIVVVFTKAVSATMQNNLSKKFSAMIRNTLATHHFIEDPVNDPPIEILSKKLGNRALICSFYLYVIPFVPSC